MPIKEWKLALNQTPQLRERFVTSDTATPAYKNTTNHSLKISQRSAQFVLMNASVKVAQEQTN